jgi:DNA-binding XRE family transcriptional regulator
MPENELTNRERLLIYRRSHQLTQPGAAKALGVPLRRYRDWERGNLRVPGKAITFELGVLSVLEEYMIARKRKGWTQGRASKELGVSRSWLSLMENESVNTARLLAFAEREARKGKI